MGTAKQTFYYAVRAVSPGQYKMGPVSADAMYNYVLFIYTADDFCQYAIDSLYF